MSQRINFNGLYKYILSIVITLQIFYPSNLVSSAQNRNDPSFTRSRQILPSDSYRILGNPGFRRLGQCNITYAWLILPPTSSLDAFGHAAACNRLQLQDGQIVESQDGNYVESNKDLTHSELELRKINKDLTASLVDLNRLDILIRSEAISSTRATQLAEDARYFFLADRVGDLNLMAVLRPGQQIKLELINPLSTEHLVTPQHALCSRKQCPVTTNSNVPSKSGSEATGNQRVVHLNQSTSAALLKAEKHNRELYMQLIISRVACALLGFLCVVLTFTSLALCIRLRRHPRYSKKGALASELSVCREPNASPSYYQMNGKVNMGQGSPLFITEPSPRHFGFTHIPSDTASMNNVVMTASNLSGCDGSNGVANVPISYAAIGSPYGQVSAYPLAAGQIGNFQENPGLITLYPVSSRTSIGSNHHGLLLTCQNGNTSPVPSNHSQSNGKNNVGRTGSLGRYSRNGNCYADAAQRKLMFQFRKTQQMDALNQMQNNRPLPLAQQQQLQQQQPMLQSQRNGEFPAVNGKPDTITPNGPNDLITFSQVHRFSTDIGPISTGKTITPQGSVAGDHDSLKSTTFSHPGEPCGIGVIRKPAHVN